MTKHCHRILPFLLTGLLIGASPAVRMDDLLTQAQRAQQTGQYHRAIQLYDQLELNAHDPGFIAYNKAVACFNLALRQKDATQKRKWLAEAEKHFARCEHDPAARQARAAFGWANCLLLQSDVDALDLDREIERIQLALKQYSRAMSLTKDDALRKKSARNVVLARHQILVLEDRRREKPPGNPDNTTQSQPQDTGTKDEPKQKKGEGTEQGTETSQGDPNGQPRNGKKEGQRQPGSNRKGSSTTTGNPLEHREDVPKVSPRDARRLLAREAKRIRDARRAARRRPASALTKALRDW